MYISCLHFISFHDVIVCLFSNFYCVKMQQKSHSYTLTLFQICRYLDWNYIFLVRPAALDNGLCMIVARSSNGESYQQSRVASNLCHHAACCRFACHATRGKCGLDRDPWVVLYLPTVQTVQRVQCCDGDQCCHHTLYTQLLGTTQLWWCCMHQSSNTNLTDTERRPPLGQ